MRNKNYWKVVKRIEGYKRYFSVRTTHSSCKYEIGKITKAEVGKLFVFNTRKNARKFIKMYGQDCDVFCILKVYTSTITPQEPRFILSYPGDYTFYNLRAWWNTLDDNNYLTSCAPKGTLLVDDVTPIEKSS